MYVRPLRNAEPPIIPLERLEQFLTDVFHNFIELHAHHRRLVDRLHQIQRDEHPKIRSITHAMMDAALNFREAYMEYIPNYPIAAYRIDEEIANNPDFKAFVTVMSILTISDIMKFLIFVLTAYCAASGRASIGYEEFY